MQSFLWLIKRFQTSQLRLMLGTLARESTFMFVTLIPLNSAHRDAAVTRGQLTEFNKLCLN